MGRIVTNPSRALSENTAVFPAERLARGNLPETAYILIVWGRILLSIGGLQSWAGWQDVCLIELSRIGYGTFLISCNPFRSWALAGPKD